jgi:hypothetical protein
MSPTARTFAWIAGLLGVGLVAGGVAYAASSKPAASATGPAARNALQLVPGHRYRLAVTDPIIGQMPNAPALSMANVQRGFDVGYGTGLVVVVSSAVAGSTWTVVFDYRGATPLALNAADLAPSASTTSATVTDLGPSPQ